MYEDEDINEGIVHDVEEQGNSVETFDEAMEAELFGMDNPPPKGEEEGGEDPNGEDTSDGGSVDGVSESSAIEADSSSVAKADVLEDAGEVRQPVGKEEESSRVEAPPVNEGKVEEGSSFSKDENKDVYKEFAYISQKIRDLESTIRTVALSIEESADLVNRVNKSTKQILDDMQEAGKVMEYKVTSFQDGTETWGADMNRLAANVKDACEASRGFLGEELKRDMKRSQEEIIRSTIDRVKAESASILMKTRDDYEELLNQVVTNYKQFCKASAQHQKELKKGYFEEIRKMRAIVYGVLAVQAVVIILLAILFYFR